MVRFRGTNDGVQWLSQQSQVVQAALAARCALRSLPGIVFLQQVELQELLLSVFRANLIGAVGPNRGDRSFACRASGAADDFLSRFLVPSNTFPSKAILAARDAASTVCEEDPKTSARMAANAIDYGNENATIAAEADAELLERGATEAVFDRALWHGREIRKGLSDGIVLLQAFWDEDSVTWGFWARWYRGMLEGSPLPWDLQEAVAKIPNNVWQKGPHAIAERIREIEGEPGAEPLDRDALRSHLETLIDATDLHADAAKSAENLIVEAIKRFKREADANILPDGFGQFENLPPTFANIARILGSAGTRDQKVADLQDEISRLYAIIAQLRSELNDAKLRLQTVRPDAFEAARTRTRGEKLQTTLTNVTLIGAVGMAALNFFGVSAEDLNYDGLKGALQSLSEAMRGVQADSPPETLPPTTEV